MNSHPEPGRAESPRGVKTDGVGKSTARHLNLAKSLGYFEERRLQRKVKHEMRLARREERQVAK